MPLVIFLVMLGGIASFAESGSAVSVDQVIPVAEQRDLAIVNPIKCGPSGEIYVRFAGDDAVNVISADGRTISWAAMTRIPEFRTSSVANARIVDFAPSDDGGVYLLLSRSFRASRVPERVVAKFDSSGNYVSQFQLDTTFDLGFVPRAIGRYRSGQFLVTGYDRISGRSVTALFASDGRFLKLVELPAEATDPTGPKDSGSSQQGPPLRVLLSTAQQAQDGNIYIARNAADGPVFSVSAGGAAKKIKLAPPDSSATLLGIKFGDGIMAVSYSYPQSSAQKSDTNWIILADAETGKTRKAIEYPTDYHRYGAGVACYRDHQFTFLAVGENGNLQLVKGH